MKITYRKIKADAWANDTWLTPYCNYVIKLKEYSSGKITMILDGATFDVTGWFKAPNGWRYQIKQLLSKPVNKNKFILK